MSFLRLYDEGKYLPITSHRPPEPFGKETYKHEKTPGIADLSRETLRQLSYDDLVYARHPRERHEPSLYPLSDWFSDDETATLKIVARKSFSHSGGAQVVLCEVKSPAATLWEKMGHKVPDLVIAKIFDPAFYLYSDKVAAADREYAQEAAAYIQLHDKRTEPSYANKSGMIPRFFGTWTMDITAKHLGNSFMSTADRKATLAQGAKARVLFDTAASEASTEFKPQEFRPVRIILLEYIKGRPLERLLIKTPDYEGHNIVEPTLEFGSEEKRLPIFASIMDTVARIEHLGVSLHEIRISPSNFILKTRTDDTKTQYDIVMIDFRLADVTKYTRRGYDIDEKLPRPMHPLTSHACNHWYQFWGWIPKKWSAVHEDGLRSFETWGESQFRITDYSTPDVVEDIARSFESKKDLQDHGIIPPEDDDDNSGWGEKLQQHANDPYKETITYENVNNFQSFDDCDEKDQEEFAKKSRALGAETAEKQLERHRELMEMAAKYKADTETRRDAKRGHSRDIEEDEERIPKREAKRKAGQEANQEAKQPAKLRKSTTDTDSPKPDMPIDANEHGLTKEDDDKNREEARKREEAKKRVDSMFDSIVAEQWALVEMRHKAFLLKISPSGIYIPGRKEGKWDWEKRSWKQREWDVTSNRKFWTLEEYDKYHDEVYGTLRTARDKSEGLDRQIMDEKVGWLEKDRAKDKERRQRQAIEYRLWGFDTQEGGSQIGKALIWDTAETRRLCDAQRAEYDKLQRQKYLEFVRRIEEKDKALKRAREEFQAARTKRLQTSEGTYLNKKNFETKEEFDADRAETRRWVAARRAEYDKQERQKYLDFCRRYEEKVKALDKEKEEKEAAQQAQQLKGLDRIPNLVYRLSPAQPVELTDPEDQKSTGPEESQITTQDERQKRFWEAGAREEAGSSSTRLISSRQGSPADMADMADSGYVQVDMLDLDQSEVFEEDDDELHRAD